MLFMNLFLFVASLYATVASDVPKIEEGCRYHGSLQVVLPGMSSPLDLSSIHMNMSQFVRAGDLLRRDKSENPCAAVVRFTCVHRNDDGSPDLGRTLFLSQDLTIEQFSPDSPAFELVFSSGYFSDSERVESKFDIDDFQVVILPPSNQRGSEKDDLGKEPEIYKTPLRLCRLSRLTPKAVRLDIDRRWGTSETFLSRGNFKVIQDLHKRTLDQITCLLNTDANIERTIQALEKDHNCYDGFLSVYRQALEKAKKEQQSKFSVNNDANNYVCAEQVAFIFLRHPVLIQNIRRFIEKERSRERRFLSCVLVNVSSSFTPCHHCATSWVRECEVGGVISEIFRELPVRLVASCGLHYTRRGKNISYSNTNCLVDREAFIRAYSYGEEAFPYPVVLFNNRGSIVNDSDKIRRFLQDRGEEEGQELDDVLPFSGDN